MLNFNAGFQKEIDLKNPNRIVLVKMYYDDESSYLALSTRSTLIGEEQYVGLITRFSAPKMTWNWDNQNNVVITSPTLELGNFESAVEDYSLIDDFYTYNFLGRKIEMFIGFQGATEEVELQQIYSGKIEDLAFSKGSIKVVFSSTDMPTNDISGRLIDYQSGKIGDTSVTYLPEDSDGLSVPVVYGNAWCSPGVCVANRSNSDKIFLFSDSTKYGSVPTGDAELLEVDRKYTGRKAEKLIYILDNEYLVPISSYDVTSDGTRLWASSSEDATYSGLAVVIDKDNVMCEENSITATIPLRLTEDHVLADSVSASIASGDWDDVQDGETTTYMGVVVSGGSINSDITVTDNGELIPYNLRYGIDGQGRYGFHTIRPIHVADKDTDFTYFHGKVGILFSTNPLPNDQCQFSWRSKVRGENGVTAIGGTGWGSFGGDNKFRPASYPLNQEFGCGVANGSWTETFTGSGFIETAFDYEPYGITGEILDATLSQRLSLDNYKLTVYAHWFISTLATDYQSLWRLYEWFLLHSSTLELPKDYVYAEIDGITVDNGEDIKSLDSTGTNVPLTRPMHYVEHMLRALGYTDTDFDTAEWKASNDLWEAIFGTRRDTSGFTITESTKFSSFLKDYLKYETYIIYRDEVGKFRVKIIKNSYDAGDVEATINYNDCDKFEMSLSKLKSVVTSIDGLKVDYQYFSDDFTYNTSWKIASSGYNYDYYSYINDSAENIFIKTDMEKRYTSYPTNYCVNYSGTSYSVRKDHTSSVGAFNPEHATFGTEFYNSVPASSAVDPEWEAGVNYTTESAEAYQLAKRYLNHYGNRHRVIKLTSQDTDFYKYQIGDVVNFENVPDTLLGMEVSGFAGSTASSTTMNGQTVYPHFMVYAVQKDLDKVNLECFQLHKLDDLDIVRG